jgi:hypothetical protein
MLACLPNMLRAPFSMRWTSEELRAPRAALELAASLRNRKAPAMPPCVLPSLLLLHPSSPPPAPTASKKLLPP